MVEAGILVKELKSSVKDRNSTLFLTLEVLKQPETLDDAAVKSSKETYKVFFSNAVVFLTRVETGGGRRIDF